MEADGGLQFGGPKVACGDLVKQVVSQVNRMTESLGNLLKVMESQCKLRAEHHQTVLWKITGNSVENERWKAGIQCWGLW